MWVAPLSVYRCLLSHIALRVSPGRRFLRRIFSCVGCSSQFFISLCPWSRFVPREVCIDRVGLLNLAGLHVCIYMRSVLISSLILVLAGVIAVSAIQWLVNDRNVSYSTRILALLVSLALVGVSALFIGDLIRRDIDGGDRERRAARPVVLHDGELEKLVYRISPSASYKDPAYYSWLMKEMQRYSAEHPFPDGGVWVEDRDGLHQLWSQFYRPEPRMEPLDRE